MDSGMTIAPRVIDRTQGTYDSGGLRAPRLLEKRPIIGFLMFLFGGLVFGALTYNLYAHGPLLQWDGALADTLPAIGLGSPALVKYLIIAGFYVVVCYGLLAYLLAPKMPSPFWKIMVSAAAL